jgi:hypothetical protein
VRHPADERRSRRVVAVAPPVFARGRLRHPDHRALKLQEWHRVLMNTEDRSVGATWVDSLTFGFRVGERQDARGSGEGRFGSA